jgi:hypothetical protein
LHPQGIDRAYEIADIDSPETEGVEGETELDSNEGVAEEHPLLEKLGSEFGPIVLGMNHYQLEAYLKAVKVADKAFEIGAKNTAAVGAEAADGIAGLAGLRG